ncbi:MAG: DUF262 domain-containing HNH endonuclease family protein [Pseudomonadota bacterium]
MSNFDSKTVNVGDLFSDDKFYKIPNYQRPFSWDADNFSDLINDTLHAARHNEYFLGTAVFYIDETYRIVVDGQQRLTSLLILISCIRDSIKDENYKKELQGFIIQKEQLLKQIPSRERLEVKDRDIFQNVVLAEGGTQQALNPKDLTEPANRYATAVEIFHEKLDKLPEQEKIEYANYLIQKCVIIYLQADNFEEAFRLFEIVNDRGKQLRRIDVLKSVNLSPENVPSNAVRDQLARKWEENEEVLGEDIFENIFFLMRLALVKEKPQGDLLAEFRDKVFGKDLIKPGEPFIQSVSEYVDLYRKIFLDRSYLQGEEEDFRFQSLMFIMDKEFRASEWRSCILSFCNKFGRESFYEFCLAIEKLFLTHWVDSVRKDERYADYTTVLNLIDASKTPQPVIDNIPSNNDRIIAELTSSDVYGKGYAKYVLLRLELTAAEFDQPRLFEAKSIEHVLPQNPDEGSDWVKLGDEEQRGDVVNKLGNLVLLSKGRNSSAGNREFVEKKATYLKNRVSDYPRSIQVLQQDEWGLELILARTTEAASRVIENP